MKIENVFSETYKVTSYLVNLRGQAGLHSILNFVQDVGWLHANALQVKLPADHGWVFTRQKLRMRKWPLWNQSIIVKTWLRKPHGPFVYRDYEFFVDQEKLGECTSTFTVMDMRSRKLANQDWTMSHSLWREENCLELIPEKLIWSSEVSERARFQVRNSDIDLNHHVNNTKYAQWILDSLPIEILRDGAILQGYEINFLAESKIGDMIVLHQSIAEVMIGDAKMIQFQGSHLVDQRPLFVARLLVL